LLIEQPPVLPLNADRAAWRNVAALTVYEDSKVRARRIAANALIEKYASKRVLTIAVDEFYEGSDGSVRVLDQTGHELFHDAGHLNYRGTLLVRPTLRREIVG
jgi:hypothetical protein